MRALWKNVKAHLRKIDIFEVSPACGTYLLVLSPIPCGLLKYKNRNESRARCLTMVAVFHILNPCACVIMNKIRDRTGLLKNYRLRVVPPIDSIYQSGLAEISSSRAKALWAARARMNVEAKIMSIIIEQFAESD